MLAAMQMTTDVSEEVTILSLDGDLNATNSRDVESYLSNIIDEGNRKLLINLDGLNYISSAGLRVMLMANKKLKNAEGELKLCGLNDTVKEVFEIAGFHMILNIYVNQEEALRDF